MAEGDRRTFATYKTEVLHALGNPDTSGMDITAGNIVNDALTHIADAMHAWQWRQTGEQNLDLTADQDYVELPADFGEMQAIHYASSWSNFMEEVNWDTLLWLRQNPIASWSGAGGYFFAVNTGNVELGAEDAGLSLATLALYPTPTTGVTDAIRIVYRRFLRRLVSDTDRPQWPAYMDRMLSLLARSYAAIDYEDNPQSAYTAGFIMALEDCKRADGRSHSNHGVWQGAIGARQPLVPFGYPEDGIPNPTSV